MGITYKDSGVDIQAGANLVERIKGKAARTFSPDVLTGLGGFGGLYRLPVAGMSEPVLVSGCDGVGTKLKIAFAMNRHDTVGIDLVAMNVNDVLTSGARPLFFLDYLACGSLASIAGEQIIEGIAVGCEQAGCALLGGETAEMPGFYPAGEYDLAGFCVALADRAKIIDGRTIAAGDTLIGLAASGLHSNGYSLARHLLFQVHKMALDYKVSWADQTLGEALLTPTRIYVRPILALLERCAVKGLVHITGGGLVDNIPRILPPGLGVDIQRGSWNVPPLFNFLNELGNLSEIERYRTFNMGLGMIIITPAAEKEKTLATIRELGETATIVGQVVPRETQEVRFV